MLLSFDQRAHDEGGTTLNLKTGLALGEGKIVDEDGEDAGQWEGSVSERSAEERNEVHTF